MEPVFLGLDEVIEIHSNQIARYGESHGIRALNRYHKHLQIALNRQKVPNSPNALKGARPKPSRSPSLQISPGACAASFLPSF